MAKKLYRLWKRGDIYYYRLRGQAGWKSTKRTARGKAEDYVLDLIHNPLREAEQQSLREYLAPFYLWERCPHIARYRAEGKRVSPAHARHQRALIANYILKDRLADMCLADIRRAHILDFRTRLLAKVGPRTTNAVLGVLKVAFREGVFREELQRDPTLGVGSIAYTKKESGVFSAAEMKRLFPLAGLGPWQDRQDHTAFLVAATCGLRRGEILALRWRHLDFERGLLHVQEAWKSETEVGEPKWGQVRTVPLPTRTAKALKALRTESNHVLPDALVFCTPEGARLGATWYTKRFMAAMKAAKIEAKARKLTGHSFRHSLNTYLRDQGYPDEKNRAALGWTNAKTQAGYTHWQPEHLSGQASIVDGIWGAGQAGEIELQPPPFPNRILRE